MELNEKNPLQLDPSGKGLPDSTTFDSCSAVIPDGVPSNISTLGCLPLQYTESDGTVAPVSQTLLSN